MPPDPAVTSDYNERGGAPAPAIDDDASVRLLDQRARAVLPGFEVTLASWPRLPSPRKQTEMTGMKIGGMKSRPPPLSMKNIARPLTPMKA